MAKFKGILNNFENTFGDPIPKVNFNLAKIRKSMKKNHP